MLVHETGTALSELAQDRDSGVEEPLGEVVRGPDPSRSRVVSVLS